MLFKKITGIHGSVTIPSVGVTIGTMGSWTLARREDSPPGVGEWDLRAVFSYLNDFAWHSNGWDKQITVVIGNPKTGRQLRVTPTSGRTVLEGKTLLIEGVDLDVD